MKASELVTEVQRIVYKSDYSGDADYGQNEILALLNEGQKDISGGSDRQHGNARLAPLPDLLTSSTVTLTTSSVAMPATFQRGLLRVVIDGEKLKKYDSLQKLLDKYEGETGEPEGYCLKGRTLWILPAPPSSKTVTLYFHRFPTAMVITTSPAADTSPDGIPDHLQKRLLVNYVCREIYAEIEGGMDMAHPEQEKHNDLLQMALNDLDRLIGPEEGEATNVGDDYLTDDNIL